jgi:type IV pilus assembly protein PilB
MGKKFLNFFSDPAAKPPDKQKSGKNGPLDLSGEEARAPGRAGGAPPLKDLSTRPRRDHVSISEVDLSPSEESATKYVQPSIDIAEFTPDDQSYLKILSEQTGLRVIDLSKYKRPPTETIKLLTKEQAERLVVVPVEVRDDGVLVIAVSDPSNPMVTDDLRAIIDREIEPVIASDAEIRERIQQYYGMGEETLEDIVSLEEKAEASGMSRDDAVVNIASDAESLANDPPVIRLVNLLLVKAIKERASDIHVEPFPNLIRIRYRVDGVLREIPSPPRHMLQGIISRIKVMGRLDIAESRMPQDGRIKLSFDGREIDLRVATVPTVHGESIVMRVLDKSMMMIGIRQIGMTDEVLERFMVHINKPNGIVLVTGPTGCGKTTTLYAGLNEINDPGDKIITVEDPVEFQVDGLIQVNINENVGLTFAKTLRAILRQDPDKVLVGEIRDVETAQISVQAALTGHLVFSTLHTNSAAATVIRLVDMGVPAFLITSSVEAVLGQRLVRTICSNCRAPYTPTEEEIDEFHLTEEMLRDQTFFYGEGCSDCGHTGYRGRMGLYELLELDDELKELILDGGTTDEVQEMGLRKGLVTMREDGWMKICLGLTTFEEVARETPRAEISGGRRTEAEAAEEEESGATERLTETPPAPRLEAPKPDSVKPTLDEDRMAVQGEEAIKVQTAKPGDGS